MVRSVAIAVLAFVPAALADEGTVGYYRTPAIHGDTIVFAAEGDLWRVPRTGGIAARLTSHPGEESAPAISPDGATLAFSAAYEGPDRGLHHAAGRRAAPSGARSTATPHASSAGRRTGKVLYATGGYSTLPDAQLGAARPPYGSADDDSPGPGRRRCYYAGRQARSFFTRCRSRAATPSATRAAPRRTSGAAPRGERGRAADRRLPRDQQGADVVAGPRLLRQRPRRHHEPVVDGRPAAATCSSTRSTKAGTWPRPPCPRGGSSTSSGPISGSSTSAPARTGGSTSASPPTSTRRASAGSRSRSTT